MTRLSGRQAHEASRKMRINNVGTRQMFCFFLFFAYLDTQVLVLSTVDQVAAHVLQRANVPGSQGDANTVHRCRIAAMGLLNVLGSSSLRIQKKRRVFEVMLSCDTPLARARVFREILKIMHSHWLLHNIHTLLTNIYHFLAIYLVEIFKSCYFEQRWTS